MRGFGPLAAGSSAAIRCRLARRKPGSHGLSVCGGGCVCVCLRVTDTGREREREKERQWTEMDRERERFRLVRAFRSIVKVLL